MKLRSLSCKWYKLYWLGWHLDHRRRWFPPASYRKIWASIWIHSTWINHAYFHWWHQTTSKNTIWSNHRLKLYAMCSFVASADHLLMVCWPTHMAQRSINESPNGLHLSALLFDDVSISRHSIQEDDWIIKILDSHIRRPFLLTIFLDVKCYQFFIS
jgi:hypothetical protein